MLVVDANLLIYAYDVNSPFHEPARQWIEPAFSSEEAIGIPLQAVLAFLRVLTHPRLIPSPIPIHAATDAVDQWLERPGVFLLMPGPGHWRILSGLCIETGATGNLIADAHMAAITLETAGTLYTNDHDFARFPGPRWVNPLDMQ